MKLCVFITGTNGTGKTTLARELQQRYGGIAAEENKISYCADGCTCFAGYYHGSKFGGVDCFGNTKSLKNVVETALQKRDVIICEGSYLHTFGNNLTTAAFTADRQLVVMLYADADTLASRLKERSGKSLNAGIWAKQKTVMSSAKKWASIGVPVLCLNTGTTSLQAMATQVQFLIKQLRNEIL